jgi:hypothetical protein
MAGETTKTTAKTAADAGTIQSSRVTKGRPVVATDVLTFSAATELEAADTRQTNITVPSNAIIVEVAARHGDLDTHACSPTLVIDIGCFAVNDMTTVTSSTATKHSAGDSLSTDAIVDGDTTFRGAVATYTAKALDATNFAAGNGTKALWEVLGYDSDPHAMIGISVTSQAAAAALGSAASVDLKVTYIVD